MFRGMTTYVSQAGGMGNLSMKAAKTLVWVMSGLIFGLLVLLVYGLSQGWHLEDPVEEGVPTNPEASFGLVELGQPAGTVVTGVADVQGRIALTLSGGGKGQRVILLDAATGELVGEIMVSKPD